MKPVWLLDKFVRAWHREQLALYGGADGVNVSTLRTVLESPKELFQQTRNISLISLATTYAFSFLENKPFADGNKRMACMTQSAFLLLNGYTISACKGDKYLMFAGLAEGAFTKDKWATWLKENTVKL